MNRFTIEDFCEIGFGVDLGCLGAEEEHPFQTAFDSAQCMLVLRFILPSRIWKTQRLLGIGTEGQLKRDLKFIDETVMDIIAESLQQRKDNNHTREDVNLVTLYLDHIENSSDAEGRETTAQALSWFFVARSRHPQVALKIREEIKRALPDLFDGNIDTPSMEQDQ